MRGAADLLLVLSGQVLKDSLVTTTINGDRCPLGHLTREASSQADTSADLPAHLHWGHSCRTAAASSVDCFTCFQASSRTSAPKDVNPEPFTGSTFSNTYLGKSPFCLLAKYRNGVDRVQIQLFDFLCGEC